MPRLKSGLMPRESSLSPFASPEATRPNRSILSRTARGFIYRVAIAGISLSDGEKGTERVWARRKRNDGFYTYIGIEKTVFSAPLWKTTRDE